MHREELVSMVRESIATKERLIESCMPQIEALCERAITCLKAGGKLLFCGQRRLFVRRFTRIG